MKLSTEDISEKCREILFRTIYFDGCKRQDGTISPPEHYFACPLSSDFGIKYAFPVIAKPAVNVVEDNEKLSTKFEKEEVCNCYPLFTYTYKNLNESIVSVPKNCLKPRKIEPIYNKYNVKSAEALNKISIKELLDYIRENGIVSFIIDEEKNIREFLTSLVSNSMLEYRKTMNSTTYSPSNINNKETITILNLFDISHCIPIFNTKHADGIGVSIRNYCVEMLKKLDKVLRVGGNISNIYIDMILSSNKENLFIVDGMYTDNKPSVSLTTLFNTLKSLKVKPPKLSNTSESLSKINSETADNYSVKCSVLSTACSADNS